MQYQATAKLVNGDANVYLVMKANVVHTGTYAVGESLTFSDIGAAAGFVTSYTPGLLSFVIPGDAKPAVGATITGDTSAVVTTISSYDFEPALTTFGIEAGDFLIRAAELVGYAVSSVPKDWKLTLSANYGGTSIQEATIYIHNSRTSRGFFLYDPRDRAQAQLRSEDARLIDSELNTLYASAIGPYSASFNLGDDSVARIDGAPQYGIIAHVLAAIAGTDQLSMGALSYQLNDTPTLLTTPSTKLVMLPPSDTAPSGTAGTDNAVNVQIASSVAGRFWIVNRMGAPRDHRVYIFAQPDLGQLTITLL